MRTQDSGGANLANTTAVADSGMTGDWGSPLAGRTKLVTGRAMNDRPESNDVDWYRPLRSLGHESVVAGPTWVTHMCLTSPPLVTVEIDSSDSAHEEWTRPRKASVEQDRAPSSSSSSSSSSEVVSVVVVVVGGWRMWLVEVRYHPWTGALLSARTTITSGAYPTELCLSWEVQTKTMHRP